MVRAPASASSAFAAPAWPRCIDRPGGWTWTAVFVACFAVYAPALTGTYLWDDNAHITLPTLRSVEGLFRIWFEVGATQQYYPVLHSAFWLEHRLWGDSVLAYHVVNVALHATAAVLFGVLLRRLAVPGAALAALLFALHPVCVESVAWISEQKNTLSLVFYLLAALAYLRFDEQRRPRDYLIATSWFALALLTKSVTATLPAALLVVLWWRRGRLDLRRDAGPLLLWFALGVAAGLHTAHVERELIGAEGTEFELSLAQRFVLAGRVVWFYVAKLLWPANLIFVYPRWTIDASAPWQWSFPAGCIVVLIALWRLAKHRRGPLAAALLHGGTLFPALGFFNVYPFVHSFVADHFQYHASLAVFALIGVGGARWLRRGRTALLAGSVAAVLIALAVLSWRQAHIYRNVFALYESTLARNPNSWMARNNLAIALAERGRYEEAVGQFQAALQIVPDYAAAHNNLGDALLRLNRLEEAATHLQRAVELEPRDALAHRNLGLALASLGRVAEAVSHFERAVQLNSGFADAELQWAISLMLTGRFGEAEPHFERAIALEPTLAHFRTMYGRALAREGRLEDAVKQLERAVALDPKIAEAHLHLALALRQLGRFEESATHYREANRLDPAVAPMN